MLTFNKYRQIVEKWQNEGYPFVYDAVLRQEVAVYDKKMNDLANDGNKEAIQQRDFIEKLFAKPVNVSDFDLGQYLTDKLLHFGVNRRIINSYANQIKNEKPDFEAPIERLGNYTLIGDFVSECGGFREKIEQILDKILSVNKEPNITLRQSLDKHPVVFQFMKGKFNARMGMCVINHNLRPILGVRVPDFENPPKEDLLATTIAHELGHWLDFGYRPQECVYEASLMQESFADIVACQMAKNAGYDVGLFINRIEGFIREFDKPELLKYRLVSEKRLKMLR